MDSHQIDQRSRTRAVLAHRCPFCGDRLVSSPRTGGRAYNGDGPYGHYLRCHRCHDQWVVEMDEHDPHDDPLVFRAPWELGEVGE